MHGSGVPLFPVNQGRSKIPDRMAALDQIASLDANEGRQGTGCLAVCACSKRGWKRRAARRLLGSSVAVGWASGILMASTIELQGTYNWAYGYTQFEPLSVTAAAGEPALTNANTVYQTILGPPFRWNFNRATATFTCVAGQQDYPTTVANFGFIESASRTLSGSTFAIQEVKQDISADSNSGPPKAIAA